MSCEVQLIHKIDDLEQCEQFLFPGCTGNANWLRHCVTAVSPTADRLVIAHGSALVVLSTRWLRGDNNEPVARLSVSCQWDSAQCLQETDEITSLACLPLIAVGQASHVGPDWTCIAVGFSSGYIRFFTEKMDLLAADHLHGEPLLQIKAISYRKGRQIGSESGEFIYGVYPSVICLLSGFSLFQTLRGCRGQVALGHAKGVPQTPSVNLDFKKYTMSSLSSTYQSRDACFVGCASLNNFDHLQSATISDGFYSNYRPSPPQQSLVATTGDRPWMSFQYTRDGAVAPLELTDVAVTVISKIPGWLGWGSKQAPEQKARPAEKVDHRFSLTDKGRAGRCLAVSPDGSLFAVTDVLGRITLLDAQKGVAIRMWKGCRDADCGFIEVKEDEIKYRRRKHSSSSSSQLPRRRALFIIIHTPKKSLLEVFALRHGPLVASFRVPKGGKLIYTPHGLLGFSTPPKKGSDAGHIPVTFISEYGLMDVMVPFHCALTDSNSSTREADLHMVKQLQNWLNHEQYDDDKLAEELIRVAQKLTTRESILQFIAVASTLEQVTAYALLAAIDHLSFEVPSVSSNCGFLQHHCKQLRKIINFFSFTLEIDAKKEWADEVVAPLNKILQISDRECQHFLEFLKHTQQISDPQKDARVVFKESSQSPVLHGLIRNLQIGTTDTLQFRSDATDEGIKTVGKICFSGLEKNPDKVDEWRENVLKSGIEPMTLTRAYLEYKLQDKSFTDVEDSIRTAVVILKALSVLAEEVPDTTKENSVKATWAEELRKILSNSTSVIIALPIAVCCKAVNIILEKERQFAASPAIEATEEAILHDWENITADVWEWDQLISQLEDAALLNAVLAMKHSKKQPAPPYGIYPFDFVPLSAQELVKGADGAVTEWVARWLCQFEFPAELLIFKSDVEFLPIHQAINLISSKSKNNIKEDLLVLPLIELSEEIEPPTDFNSKIIGNLKILKTRFPFALTTSALLCNIAWELFTSWQKEPSNIKYLQEALYYLQHIPSAHLRGAISNLAWSTHIKVVFEGVCRLLGKIGRLPTDQLCSRELNISRAQISLFLDATTFILSVMLDAYAERPVERFPEEAIRDNRSLVAAAVAQPPLNEDLLLLHHQVSSALHLFAALDIKYPRLLAALFDSLKSELFGALNNQRCLSLLHPGLNGPRLQFLKRAVSESVRTIQEVEGDSGDKRFDTEQATLLLSECFSLASAWRLPLDDLRRQHACELYSCGLDRLAEEVINAVNETTLIASQLLVVAGLRVKALLDDSQNYTELVSNLNPTLTSWLNSLDGEILMETEWCKQDCELLLSRILQWLPADHCDYNLANLLAESLPGLAQDA